MTHHNVLWFNSLWLLCREPWHEALSSTNITLCNCPYHQSGKHEQNEYMKWSGPSSKLRHKPTIPVTVWLSWVSCSSRSDVQEIPQIWLLWAKKSLINWKIWENQLLKPYTCWSKKSATRWIHHNRLLCPYIKPECLPWVAVLTSLRWQSGLDK